VAAKKTARKPAVALRLHARLTPVHPGDVLVTVSVGPDNEAIAVWSSPEGRDVLRSRTTRPVGASFPDPRPSHPVGVRVVTYAPQARSVVTIAELGLAHCLVQPLPGERLLVVGARCQTRSDGPDRNAVIVDATGTVARQGTLGDGIQHVLTTSSGKIWVGYFDEGVFGNYGWGGDGPQPLGWSGLIRFNGRFEPEWRFPQATAEHGIDDCYALNVTGEDAWACYYSDFPVIHVSDDRLTTWPTSGAAATAVLIGDDTCVLVGGYRNDRDRLVTGTLDAGRFTKTRQARLAMPAGQPLPDGTLLVGRGRHLHAFTGTDWHRVSLDDIRQAL
jgi:hypothetical protein